MSEASNRPGGSALRAADYLSLAAAPTFLAMALLTRLFGDGDAAMICSGAQGPSLLSGMAPMYLLMGAFHAAAWLKLAARRDPREPTATG
jgi:hypothetical protein